MKTLLASCLLALSFPGVARAAAAPMLWIGEIDQVQEIDTATDQVVQTFPVDLPPNSLLGPVWQAPAGGTLYVAIDNDNEIYELDPQTGQKIGAITLANPSFGFFSPSWNGRRLYVGLVGDGGNGSNASFQAFGLSNDRSINQIDAKEEWFVDAVGPSDARVYAGSRDANNAYVLGPDGQQLAHWTIGTDPFCDPATVLVSADGRRAYVACRSGSPTFEVINTANGAVIKSVEAGLPDVLWAMPAPTGDIWVLGLDGGGTLYVFDATTYALKQTQPLGLDLLNYAGMAISPDGTRFYLADASPNNNQPSVVVYDSSSLQAVDTVSVPALPFLGFHALTEGGFFARQQSLSTVRDAQLSGSLQLVNATGCAPTYQLLEQPSHGSLNLDAATGDFTYTPDSGFTGVDVFTWRAVAPDSCTAADNPTLPRTNVAAVSVSVIAFGGSTSADVAVGASGQVQVKARGVGPWSITATSSNAGIADVSAASCPPGEGTATCTLTLKGVSAGSAVVTAVLTDAYGGTGQRTIQVTVSRATGGGGALGAWPDALLGLFALLVLLRRRGRSG